MTKSNTDFSIISRLNFTLRILLFSLVITGIVGTSALVYLNLIEAKVIHKIEPLTNINSQLNLTFLYANHDALSYILTDQSAFLAQYQNMTQQFGNTYHKELTLENQLHMTDQLLKNEDNAALNSFAIFDNLIRRSTGNSSNIADLTAIVTQINTAGKVFENNYATTNAQLENQQKKYQTETDIISIIAIGFNLAIFLISLIIGLNRSSILTSSIQGLLSRITSTLKAQEKGDLSARAETSFSKEEIELANAINSMASEHQSLQILLEQQYEQEKVSRQNLEEERTLREVLAATLYKDLDASVAFQKAVEGFGKALKADRAVVRMLEKGTPGTAIHQWISPSLEIQATDNFADESFDQARRLLYLESNELSNAHSKGAYVAVNDVANDERLSENSRIQSLKTGLGAFISIPVVGASGPEAVLLASIEGKTRTWSDRDIQIGTTLAAGLSATLTAIRLYDSERENLDIMRKLDKTKDEFLASISHELRTPLTSIIGYLELLKDEVEAGKISIQYAKMLDAIDRNSVRLLDLIENVLTASRIESGKLEISASKFPVSQLISASTETIIPQAAAKQINIDIQLQPDLADVTGDINLLDRAMLNLLSNAVKFTPPNGVITIAAKTESGNLEISVADTGMGIPEEEIGQMFTKFYRTSQAKEGFIQGTGLGLSIAKAIIEAHSGTIEVESTLGKGTKFTFTIPYNIHKN